MRKFATGRRSYGGTPRGVPTAPGVREVSRRRVDEALERVCAAAGAASPPTRAVAAEDEIVPVDSLRGAKRLVARSSVLYLRAQGDYVRVVTEEGRFLLRASLGEMARRWESLGFVRVHRQYLVNLRRARELRPELNGSATLVFAGGREVPVARRRVHELRRRLHL